MDRDFIKFKVQSKDKRFSGSNGDNAVSSGAAVQPAQPGDSHRVNDSHLSPAGDNQNAGGVAAQETAERGYGSSAGYLGI